MDILSEPLSGDLFPETSLTVWPLKINKSQIARELEVDRRTVDKYINGYTKPETWNCDDCITHFYDIIAELLSDRNQQVFYYRKVLWKYLLDNHGFTGVYCNFCHYLRKYPEFDSYFRKSRSSNTNNVTIRYETDMWKQEQPDWKESNPFILSSGETINVNIFVLMLSYSWFRVYRVSLTKAQDILFSFLDDAFETFGCVPDEIVTDNMKTVMDKARTEYFEGKYTTDSSNSLMIMVLKFVHVLPDVQRGKPR